MKQERDYILGTHQAELDRLKLQHQIWRPHVLRAWQKAGISIGSKVLDVGAGPGFATFDLQDIVGENGKVLSVERSKKFVNHLLQQANKGPNNVAAYELDLMDDPIPAKNFDFAWCRWVACFVHSPKRLVQKIGDSLKPKGRVIFHEYVHYESWEILPPNEHHKKFVNDVVKSWRAQGGEPNIAAYLPEMLHQNNFDIVATKPLVFNCSTKDYFWQWPKSFIEINLLRQVELGEITKQWADEMLKSFKETENNPYSMQITPLVLEIIAEKR